MRFVARAADNAPEKQSPAADFGRFLLIFFTFFIGVRVSFYEFLSGFTGRPWSGLRTDKEVAFYSDIRSLSELISFC